MSEPTRPGVGLEGAPNFRDIGGYRNQSGRVFRTGLVYRSESLSYLTDADLEKLRTLSIGLVVDIRSSHEKRQQSSRWPPDRPRRTLFCDVDADLRAGQEPLISALRASPSVEGARQLLRESYGVMPTAFARHLFGIFAQLARADCPPAVLHCTVGKDRTGFLTAMLLFALGMSRETVYEDYLFTAHMPRNPRLAATLAGILRPQLRVDLDPAVMDTLLGVEAEYLDVALQSIERSHGSVECYLAVAGGLDSDTRKRLQERLLV